MVKKVSIIVPVYNVKDYLRTCIDSIRAQSYQSIEIILIDDGSTDGSSAVCDEYAHLDPAILVVHTANAGASAARNRGIDLAKGDYIQFVDSDDEIEAGMTEACVRELEKGSPLVVTAFSNVNDSGLPVSQQERLLNAKVTKKGYLRTIADNPKASFYGVIWNKMYILQIIQENGIRFNEQMRYSEDILFNMRYLQFVEGVSLLSKTYYRYNTGNQNSVMHQKIDAEDLWHAKKASYQSIQAIFRQVDLYEQYEERIALWLVGEMVEYIKGIFHALRRSRKETIARYMRLREETDIQIALSLYGGYSLMEKMYVYTMRKGHVMLLYHILLLRSIVKHEDIWAMEAR